MDKPAGYGNAPWEIAWRKWRRLAERGYPEGCNHPSDMEKVDEAIRKAKAEYRKLLQQAKEGDERIRKQYEQEINRKRRE